MKKGLAKKIGLWTMVNIVLLSIVLIAFGREYIGNKQIQRTIAQMQEDKEALNTQRSSTLALIDYLSSESFLEEEGREQGLGKEGETLLVVQLPEEEDEEVLQEERSYLLAWFTYFFAPEER
jgi:cell division protein FtsB